MSWHFDNAVWGQAMKLTFFKIEHYRSITKAEFKKLSDVAILVGPNNEGKSNILQALHTCLILLSGGQYLVHRVRTERGETIRIRYDRDSYDWDSDYPVDKQAKNPEGRSIFELHFSLTDEEQKAFLDTTGSRLNDVLPIQLQFGSSPYASFKVLKQGIGGSTLSKKVEVISQFVGSTLDYVYIPAIRTAETSIDLINSLVRRELGLLEKNPRYVQIQGEIAKLQQPIIDSIVSKLKATLQEFLGPSFKNVSLSIQDRSRTRSLGREAQVLIDDGTRTTLERKGDGVKSLVAISLMTRALQSDEAIRDAILLIEEPESHLHPRAIHQLREVLDTLKKDRQIVITTHCPVLINRADVASNIIVSKNKASPAKSLDELRQVLGVRTSDNLRHAALVIVVEGTDDAIALSSLFSTASDKLRSAITSGSVAFDSIGGASKLRYGLSQLQSALCNYYIVLDDDDEARRGFEEATKDSLASQSNTSFFKLVGLQEAEIEDIYSEGVYADYFRTKYGVDVRAAHFKSKDKWSGRIRKGMQRSGKSSGSGDAWPEHQEMADKRAIAELVAKAPRDAVLPARQSVMDSIVTAVESALDRIST
jgi:AAA domain, putative AbiEii toxin, Type IV TA system